MQRRNTRQYFPFEFMASRPDFSLRFAKATSMQRECRIS